MTGQAAAGEALDPAVIEDGGSDVSTPLIEGVLWLLLVLVAGAVRFAALAAQPLSIAEGRSAFAAWSFAAGRVPPGWSGSLLGAAQALLIKLFGASDAIVRLPAAAAGTALVASLFLLRPAFGRRATLLTAGLAALSPVLVLDARNAAGQSVGALLGVLWLALLLRFVGRPRPRLFILLVAGFLLGLGSDASFLALLLVSLAPAAVMAWWRRSPAALNALAAVRANRDWWLSAAPLSLAALLLILSRFGTSPERLRPAALASWAAMFVPERAGVPWHYLPDVLLGYELPLVMLAVIGAWFLARRAHCGVLLERALLWSAGIGLALVLLMASRDSASLDVAVLPLCLLGGVALSVFSRLAERAAPNWLDAMLATGLLTGLVYAFLQTDALVQHSPPPSAALPLAGAFVAAICLGGALLRIYQEGVEVSAATMSLALAAGLLFELHGAGSVAFAGGDEFLAGQRTTTFAPAMAQLMQARGGGVSTVMDTLLPPLAWYLRDTSVSGGHGGARIAAPGSQPQLGFATVEGDVLISRTWAAEDVDVDGILRWWIARKAWGPAHDSLAELRAEGQ